MGDTLMKRAFVAGSGLTACAMLGLVGAMPAKAADIQSLCSGIGEEAAAEAAAFKHTLKLVYAEPNGDYLGGVTTEVSKDGQPVLTETCPGPWLLIDLPSGAYQISSTLDGQTKSSTVRVTGSAREAVVRFSGS